MAGRMPRPAEFRPVGDPVIEIPGRPIGGFCGSASGAPRRHFLRIGGLAPLGLGLPALEYALKCSHLFNLLDSSGSVGVTERTAYILRVRQLAVAVCRRYADDLAPKADTAAAAS